MKSLTIGIDGNEANLPTRVGVGQYALNILKALHKIDKVNRYYIYLKSEPLSDLPPARDNWQYIVFGPSKLWTRIALPLHLYLDGRKLDLFYTPGHYTPLFSPFPLIPTIHDLGYLDSPREFNQKDFHQLKNWTESSLRKAHHIIAVSEFTKSEVNRIYGVSLNKISVAFNGANPPPKVSQSTITGVQKKFNIASPYFLYLGTLKPNKNIPFLIKAFAQYLNSDNNIRIVKNLVIAGKKGWQYNEVFAAAQNENIEDQVIFTDYISESEKWALYSGAKASVLPSTYEGFGIPAIESQAVGTPVIVSDIRAFREVVGNSAILIDPNNVNSLVMALEEVTRPDIREKLIKTGNKNYPLYSWDNAARSLLKAFQAI